MREMKETQLCARSAAYTENVFAFSQASLQCSTAWPMGSRLRHVSDYGCEAMHSRLDLVLFGAEIILHGLVF
jgi:hypothetical protein